MFTKLKCLFPHAIKPWQKSLCVSVGVSSFIGSVGLASYTMFNFGRKNNSKKQTKIDQTFDQTFFNKTSDKIFNKFEKTVLNINPNKVDAVGIGIFSTFFGLCSIHNINKIFGEGYLLSKQIIGTTECCNIIRSTALSSIKISGYGILVIIFGTTSVSSFIESKDLWKKPFINATKINEK